MVKNNFYFLVLILLGFIILFSIYLLGLYEIELFTKLIPDQISGKILVSTILSIYVFLLFKIFPISKKITLEENAFREVNAAIMKLEKNSSKINSFLDQVQTASTELLEDLRIDFNKNMQRLIPSENQSILGRISRKIYFLGYNPPELSSWLDQEYSEFTNEGKNLRDMAGILPLLGFLGSLIAILYFVLPNILSFSFQEIIINQNSFFVDILSGMAVAFTTTLWGIFTTLHLKMCYSFLFNRKDRITLKIKNLFHTIAILFLDTSIPQNNQEYITNTFRKIEKHFSIIANVFNDISLSIQSQSDNINAQNDLIQKNGKILQDKAEKMVDSFQTIELETKNLSEVKNTVSNFSGLILAKMELAINLLNNASESIVNSNNEFASLNTKLNTLAKSIDTLNENNNISKILAEINLMIANWDELSVYFKETLDNQIKSISILEEFNSKSSNSKFYRQTR